MNTPKLLLGLAAALLAGAGIASADITIRISVKAVLNPATGNRQPGVSDATFATTFAGMNAMLQSYGRGYQLQWAGNALINVALNRMQTTRLLSIFPPMANVPLAVATELPLTGRAKLVAQAVKREAISGEM